jgi:hypothetical protein
MNARRVNLIAHTKAQKLDRRRFGPRLRAPITTKIHLFLVSQHEATYTSFSPATFI